LGGVSATVNRRSSRVSGRRVEYSYSCDVDGAKNRRYQLAFWAPAVQPEHLEGYEHDWKRLAVPECLLMPLGDEFVLYFGRTPWSFAGKLVSVWVAMRVLDGWEEDGRPRYKYAAAEQQAFDLVLPPFDPSPGATRI